MNTIEINGIAWRVQSATDKKMILIRDAGRQLAAWRKKKNLNQRAAAAALGISQASIARIERGERGCPARVMKMLS